MFKKMLIALAATALLVGCGGSGTTPTGGSTGGSTGGDVLAQTRDYVATQQPGDVWAWTLNASTFTGANETLGNNYSGSLAHLSSGFSLLTIDASNDPDVVPGSKAYAVEIPGTCILVRPAGGDEVLPIIGTGLGSNPTEEAMSMNWITVPSAGFDVNTDDAFGVAHFTRTETGYSLNIDFGKLTYESGDLEEGMGGTLVVRDGRYVVAEEEEGGDTVFGLQRSGVFMADNGPNLGGIIGMNVPSSPLPWSDIAGREFIGMLVKSNRSQLVKCSPGADPGTLRGYGLFSEEDIASGTPDDPDSGVILSLIAETSPGLFTVYLTGLEPGASDEKMFVIAGVVDGKRVLFGFGGNENDGTYNVLLVEKS